MARVTLGGVISSLNGSIGGTTYQAGRSGIVAKNKGYRTQKSSYQSDKAKVALSKISQAWCNLSQSDRDLWNNYAVFKPVSQKNNVGRFLNGQQIFNLYNSAYLLQFDTLVSTPVYDVTPCDFRNVSVVNDGANLNVRLSTSMDEATEFLMFKISAQCKSSQGRAVGGVKSIYCEFGGSYEWDITSDYIAFYGAIPAVGAHVEIEIQFFRADCPNWTNKARVVTTVEVY